MKRNKFIHTCFILNIAGIVLQFLSFILIGVYPDLMNLIYFDSSFSTLYQIIVFPFFTATLILWVYNLRFLYKYDRYSRNILPLILFSFFYSPIYYYKVQIKKRPLKNEINFEPVIQNTIPLEEYENNDEYLKDL